MAMAMSRKASMYGYRKRSTGGVDAGYPEHPTYPSLDHLEKEARFVSGPLKTPTCASDGVSPAVDPSVLSERKKLGTVGRTKNDSPRPDLLKNYLDSQPSMGRIVAPGSFKFIERPMSSGGMSRPASAGRVRPGSAGSVTSSRGPVKRPASAGSNRSQRPVCAQPGTSARQGQVQRPQSANPLCRERSAGSREGWDNELEMIHRKIRNECINKGEGKVAPGLNELRETLPEEKVHARDLQSYLTTFGVALTDKEYARLERHYGEKGVDGNVPVRVFLNSVTDPPISTSKSVVDGNTPANNIRKLAFGKSGPNFSTMAANGNNAEDLGAPFPYRGNYPKSAPKSEMGNEKTVLVMNEDSAYRVMYGRQAPQVFEVEAPEKIFHNGLQPPQNQKFLNRVESMMNVARRETKKVSDANVRMFHLMKNGYRNGVLQVDGPDAPGTVVYRAEQDKLVAAQIKREEHHMRRQENLRKVTNSQLSYPLVNSWAEAHNDAGAHPDLKENKMFPRKNNDAPRKPDTFHEYFVSRQHPLNVRRIMNIRDNQTAGRNYDIISGAKYEICPPTKPENPEPHQVRKMHPSLNPGRYSIS